MDDLKYFLNEFMKRNPDQVAHFGGIAYLSTSIEMLKLSEDVLVKATDELAKAENESERQKALKKLNTAQFLRKVFRKIAKSGNTVTEEFNGFRKTMFGKPKDMIDKEINRIIISFNRQV